jgi:hypothetical protein
VQLHGSHDVAQQRVARGMTLAVVDLFETVDVNEGEHELSITVSRTVDLLLKRDHPQPPSKRAGERIELRESELLCGLLTVARRQSAVRRGLRSVSRRACSISTPTITYPPAILARRLWFPVSLRGGNIAQVSSPVARVGSEIAPVRGLIPTSGTIKTLRRCQGTRSTGHDPLKRALQPVSPRRLIHVI